MNELPPLPESKYSLCHHDEGGSHDMMETGYTENQMQAYARAAIEAHEARKVPEGCQQTAERIKHLERVLVQARYSMQYHTDQTRPIFNTQNAIAAIDEALKIPIANPSRSAHQ